MDSLILLAAGVINLACFFIGANVGQKVAKGENIESPNLNPMQAIRERQDKKAAQQEQDRIDTIMHNVETYNGTGQGQKEVPRG